MKEFKKISATEINVKGIDKEVGILEKSENDQIDDDGKNSQCMTALFVMMFPCGTDRPCGTVVEQHGQQHDGDVDRFTVCIKKQAGDAEQNIARCDISAGDQKVQKPYCRQEQKQENCG